MKFICLQILSLYIFFTFDANIRIAMLQGTGNQLVIVTWQETKYHRCKTLFLNIKKFMRY